MGSTRVGLKVCGMKYPENIAEIAALQPDYMGFIFWEHSSRFAQSKLPQLPDTIKKVGVFVDAEIEGVISTIEKYGLQAIQLHGKETPEYCKMLRECHAKLVSASHNQNLKQAYLVGKQVQVHEKLEIIKVFSIRDNFDFDQLKPYEEVCDHYLFDTKGKLPGGNGYTFNWKVLKDYPSQKPFFLSGGIGLEEVEKIKAILKTGLPIHAIDVNSRFESEPGLKKIEDVQKFKELLYENV